MTTSNQRLSEAQRVALEQLHIDGRKVLSGYYEYPPSISTIRALVRKGLLEYHDNNVRITPAGLASIGRAPSGGADDIDQTHHLNDDCPGGHSDDSPQDVPAEPHWAFDGEFTAHGGTPMEAWVFFYEGEAIATHLIPKALAEAVRRLAESERE